MTKINIRLFVEPCHSSIKKQNTSFDYNTNFVKTWFLVGDLQWLTFKKKNFFLTVRATFGYLRDLVFAYSTHYLSLSLSLSLRIQINKKTRKDHKSFRIQRCHLAFLKLFTPVLTIQSKLSKFYLNAKLSYIYLNKVLFYKFLLYLFVNQTNIKLL